MFRRRRTLTAAATVAVLTAGLLAGCGGDVAEAPLEAAESPSVAGTEPAEPASAPDTTTAPVASAAPGSSAADAAPGDATTAAPAPTTAAVPEVLAFTATLVGGGSFDAASLAGRPALLWFWAPF